MLDHSKALQDITKKLEFFPQYKSLISAMNGFSQMNPHTRRLSSHSGQPRYTKSYLMWKEQSGLNFPLLYLSSIYLYIYAKQRGCDTFLFATRDCCHWFKIFKKLFPNENSHYFHSSRNMFGKGFRDPHPIYKEYVSSLITDMDKTIYVDLHGSGQHMFNYFHKTFDVVPHCFLLSSGCEDYDSFPHIARKYIKLDEPRLISLIFNVNGGPIEMLNYDLIGTLQDFTTNGPLRDVLEYDYSLVKRYHKPMNIIIDNLLPMDVIGLGGRYGLDELHEVIKYIFNINQNNTTIIRQKVHHIGRHKKIEQVDATKALETDTNQKDKPDKKDKPDNPDKKDKKDKKNKKDKKDKKNKKDKKDKPDTKDKKDKQTQKIKKTKVDKLTI